MLTENLSKAITLKLSIRRTMRSQGKALRKATEPLSVLGLTMVKKKVSFDIPTVLHQIEPTRNERGKLIGRGHRSLANQGDRASQQPERAPFDR